MVLKHSEQTELLVWGFPVVMVFEYDLYKSAARNPVINTKEKNNSSFDNGRLAPFLSLIDTNGREHPVYKTHRNMVRLSCKPVTLMPVLNELIDCGLQTVRLDCLYMQDSMVETVVRVHKKALNKGTREAYIEAYNELSMCYPEPTFGAFGFTVSENV
jgi:hypothetical protein